MKKIYQIVIHALFITMIISLAACQAPKNKTAGWSSTSGEIRPGPNTGKAVLALLTKARLASKRGLLSSAESYLERALRIEPQNPTLWLYLAKIRLFSKMPIEAIDLAKKALALSARGGRASKNERVTVQADSWRVIAHAYLKMNDIPKAQSAQDKSNALSL